MGRKRDNTHSTPSLDTSLDSLLRPARTVAPVRVSTLPVSRYDLATETVEILGDDGRTYHPLGPRRPQMRASGQVATLRRAYHSITHNIGFVNPKNVIRCVRRKTRRQVLFAFNKQRKKGQSGGRYKRNYWSEYKC